MIQLPQRATSRPTYVDVTAIFVCINSRSRGGTGGGGEIHRDRELEAEHPHEAMRTSGERCNGCVRGREERVRCVCSTNHAAYLCIASAVVWTDTSSERDAAKKGAKETRAPVCRAPSRKSRGVERGRTFKPRHRRETDHWISGRIIAVLEPSVFAFIWSRCNLLSSQHQPLNREVWYNLDAVPAPPPPDSLLLLQQHQATLCGGFLGIDNPSWGWDSLARLTPRK